MDVTRDRLEEITRIIARAAELAGDTDRASAWFRRQPLPGFGGQTAEELVRAGHAGAVKAYLAGLGDGVHA